MLHRNKTSPAGAWSSHQQYGLYHQSSRLRQGYPQDALLALALENAEEDLQAEYWKSLYPGKVKRIQHEVEQVCSRLDYPGSFIYDEYPDRLNLERTAREIAEKLRKEEEFREPLPEELYEINTPRRPGPPPFGPPPGNQSPPPYGPPPGHQGPPPYGPPPRPPKQDSWLDDMIRVLLYQEISRRRCRGRNCRRRFYY